MQISCIWCCFVAVMVFFKVALYLNKHNNVRNIVMAISKRRKIVWVINLKICFYATEEHSSVCKSSLWMQYWYWFPFVVWEILIKHALITCVYTVCLGSWSGWNADLKCRLNPLACLLNDIDFIWIMTAHFIRLYTFIILLSPLESVNSNPSAQLSNGANDTGQKTMSLDFGKNCVVFRNVALAQYAIVHLFAATDDVVRMKVPGCVEIGIEWRVALMNITQRGSLVIWNH